MCFAVSNSPAGSAAGGVFSFPPSADLVRRGDDLEPEEIRLAFRWLELNEPASWQASPSPRTRLPRREAEVVRMFYLEEKTLAVIGAALGVSDGRGHVRGKGCSGRGVGEIIVRSHKKERGLAEQYTRKGRVFVAGVTRTAANGTATLS